jgi:hypothetical protein
MSDQNEESPAAPEAPAAKVAKKRPAVRKSSKPAAKSGGEPAPSAAPESSPEPSPTPAAVSREEAAPAPSTPAESSAPDSSDGGRIAFLVETPAPDPGGGSKKRRRRKKKHGQGQGGPQGQPQHPHAVSVPGDVAAHVPSATSAEPPHSQAPAMHAAPRPKLDSEQVAKKAWKIFQSEVGEEGLALIDDHDAREISRRCFRLAEIFLEEAARRAQR